MRRVLITLTVVAVGLLGLWVMARIGAQLAAIDAADEVASPGAPIGLSDIYDPVLAGEPLPDGFRQLTRRDAIAPIYDPVYVEAGSVDWPADTLVVGVALDGASRAYPVGILNRREMVIDRIAGIPVLVTW
jgi:hypothetical protein